MLRSAGVLARCLIVPNSPQVLIAKGFLAVATCAGDPTQAAALAADAHERALACLGPRHPTTLHVKALQGYVQLLCGNDAPGARLLREAIAGMRGALGVGHPRLTWAKDILVPALHRLVRRFCRVSCLHLLIDSALLAFGIELCIDRNIFRLLFPSECCRGPTRRPTRCATQWTQSRTRRPWRA